MTKWRDLIPFGKVKPCVYNKTIALNYWMRYGEWVYFLPREIALPLWRIEKLAWKLGFLGLFVYCMVMCLQ